ncbi:MFS transporter [Saccharopolyspora griseoalba]|uniref:MFS transporter n=1 Tax=Saccharopolyspora griseoalba TaxID=1431848 RepID=A0ABW2LT84_9PSEU
MPVPVHNTRAAAGARTPRCGEKPTEPKSAGFVFALGFAQFGLYVALLGPVMVSMALKVATLTDVATERTAALGTILGPGAIAAVVANVVFGRLSDRTTSRFGRRKPWIVGGAVAMALALLWVSQAGSVPGLLIGWVAAQLAANACFSPFIATLSDQLPEKQHAKVSAMVGIMQNVGILGATQIASALTDDMLLLFAVPAAIGVIGMLIYAAVLPDPVLEAKPGRLDFRELLRTFWVNPLRHPDFGLAWASRFCVILASFLFTTFRFNFLVDRLGLDDTAAAGAVATATLVYTIALVGAGWLAGVISDRTGKRKSMVAASALLFGIGTAMLAHTDTLTAFYLVEAIMGVAYGIYVSVDMALVLEVLPDPDDAGKDLGVFNIANALPQSAAPFLGAMLLGAGAAAGGPNYSLLLWAAGLVCLAGALVILPIKKVR